MLSEFCCPFNLTQLIKQPTRITEKSATLIDVTLVSNTSLVEKAKAVPCSISDHDLVCVRLLLEKELAKPVFITTRSFKRYDQSAFQRDMSPAPWSVVDTFDNVEDKLNAFHLIFNQILDLHAPIKNVKVRSRPNPYVTDENISLMRTRDNRRKKKME